MSSRIGTLCRRACAWGTGLLLAACASGPTPESTTWIIGLEAMGLAPDANVESIPNFRIDGYKVIDDLHVVLYTGRKQQHVVTLRDNCRGLETAQRLGHTSSGGALTRFDKLIVVEFQSSEPCPIAMIQTLKVLPVPR